MSRGQVAAKVAANKARHPELYCPNAKCLWRTGGGYCPRHQPANSRQLETRLEMKEVLK